ncbi:LacI family DNA-binding transcriptional regulator [Paraburkholderia kirstenboschensis]|uniref:LacI family DNA-binding transcriptional regulator n=1 Tax=Paraburkholderia kirstenboschensis TaxID=1245436 RepID=A0ABZ0EHF4_9BURK|nr:LacI family DNA-binding transcriptional regulator [Paraburkholderia kirstenboschensis]WOD15637.1 LacI family DNA-binding transcriptional regulator [Paraburkholderia kirstenboschensis]
MPATRMMIARRAGVSVATVDRVLRDDQAVRPETAERVHLALSALRDDRASRGRPAKINTYRVAFVLPQVNSRFLDHVERDIALSASFFREHRIIPSFYRCDFASHRDTIVFAQQAIDYDALVLVPLDYPAVERLIEDTSDAGVPVVTVFSDLPASRRAAYVGVDNRIAGRTAGALMGRFLGARLGTVAVLSGSSRLHDQLERRTGFSQVLEEDFRNLRWIAEPDFTEDDDGAGLAAQGLIARHPDLVGVYATGGGISGIAKALQESGDKSRLVLIGHECTAATRTQLSERAIDVILDQDVRGIVHWSGLVAVNCLNDVRGALAIPTPETRIYLRENAHA